MRHIEVSKSFMLAYGYISETVELLIYIYEVFYSVLCAIYHINIERFFLTSCIYRGVKILFIVSKKRIHRDQTHVCKAKLEDQETNKNNKKLK